MLAELPGSSSSPRAATHQGRGLQSLVSACDAREREVSMAPTTPRLLCQPWVPWMGRHCTVHTSQP